MKFKTKPIIKEAIQWTGKNDSEVIAFMNGSGVRHVTLQGQEFLEINTLEGFLYADKKDWIIKGIKGEFYPCKPDIFESTYEPCD